MINKKIIFLDLDDTLITTHTGETFPKGIWDMEILWPVWDVIKKMKLEYIFIVTNQGGIGTYVSAEMFERKLDYITDALATYCISDGEAIEADSMYCPSIDKTDEYRKPNTGMLSHLCELYELNDKGYTKDDMLMVGDASGKVTDFSDSDKRCAENFGIDYLDVNDFINLSFD